MNKYLQGFNFICSIVLTAIWRQRQHALALLLRVYYCLQQTPLHY